MPGPRATIRKKRDAAPNSPTKKVQKRLDARINGWHPMQSDSGRGLLQHKPGSQNRKK
jgi:hypothetical protein